jgi:hypothetical protein
MKERLNSKGIRNEEGPCTRMLDILDGHSANNAQLYAGSEVTSRCRLPVIESTGRLVTIKSPPYVISEEETP